MENVLNFHSGDKDYYEEWYEEVTDKEGWISYLNMPSSTQYDFIKAKLNKYISVLNIPAWRTYLPQHLLYAIEKERLKYME